MEKHKRLILLVALIVMCGSWAFAQDSSTQTTQPTTTGVAAGAQAGSTAVINQQGSISGRQLITATPGLISPGVYPGVPIPNENYQLFFPAAERVFLIETLERMQKQHGGFSLKSKVRWSAMVGDLKLDRDPIQLVPYWPLAIGYPEDKVIGDVEVECAADELEEECLATGLLEAKRRTNTNRVAVAERILRTGVTKGLSIGTGGAASRMVSPSGIGNDAVGVAVGGMLGVNKVSVVETRKYRILCMNKGPYEAPKLDQPKPAPPPPPPPTQVTVNIPPIEIKSSPTNVNFNLPPEFAELIKALAHPSPAPAPQAQNTCDAGSLPDLTVLFDFDKSDVKPEYRSKIREFVSWLGANKACHVQVEGHTCRSGTFEYDAALARRRAKAVYDVMMEDGGKPEQIEQFVSLSKDRLASESEAPNRRAIVRIIGPASGK